MTDVKLYQLNICIWNHLNVCKKKKNLNSLRCYLQNVFTNHIYLIYMYKEDLALYNLQRLICHKTQPLNEILTFTGNLGESGPLINVNKGLRRTSRNRTRASPSDVV